MTAKALAMRTARLIMADSFGARQNGTANAGPGMRDVSAVVADPPFQANDAVAYRFPEYRFHPFR